MSQPGGAGGCGEVGKGGLVLWAVGKEGTEQRFNDIDLGQTSQLLADVHFFFIQIQCANHVEHANW